MLHTKAKSRLWTIRCLIGAVFEYAAVYRDLRCLLYAQSDKCAHSTALLPGPLQFNLLMFAESYVSLGAATNFDTNHKNHLISL